MTLTGGPFGRVDTDNPVKIGDNFCLVESTSDDEIKCRIALERPRQFEAIAEVLVFAKASEEMVCEIGDGTGCTFEYVDPIAVVSGISQSFDAQSKRLQLTVQGVNFDADDLVGTELFIDGFKQ